MAGERVKLVVKERESRGSRNSRRLRREGFVPGVLYGSGKPRAIYVGERDLRHALGGGHGMHAILDVVLDGQEKAHHAVLKDYQLDPRRSTLIHVDFHEVRLDRPIQAQVVIEPVGTAEGVTQGGVLQVLLREATVEALPMEVPERLEIDVSALQIGENARVSDLVAPGNVTILDDPDTVVVSVLAPRLIEEAVEEEAEVEEGVEEGEEAPEAEAQAEVSEGEPAAEES